MLLTSIMQGIQFNKMQGDLNKQISAIAYDSREVVPGSLFVAISGYTVDGHNFIKHAIERGAVAVILEEEKSVDKDITLLKVSDSRNALACISANFYKHPSKELNLIGITGTNGKTSISYFIKSIFDCANKTTGVIGTNGILLNDKQTVDNSITTPESLNTQRIFSKMNELKTKNCIMEVSSHALQLSRVAYNYFNTSIFTNLSPDHLELHKSMEKYFYEKSKLLELATDFNIINADDKYGQRLIGLAKNYNAKTITYGINNNADIYPTNINYSFDGTTYTVNTPTGKAKIKVNLPGDIYLSNSLAAIACAYCNDIPIEFIQKGIYDITAIEGRFDVVYQKDDFKVIIDFAHTEDALEKTLNTVKPYVKGRIILVFGVYADLSESGKNKRIGMGKVAAKYADLSIVTSDNPKFHDQNIILQEISQAMEENKGTFKAIIDREEAIRTAINISEESDVIVITGKGHETSQIIGDVEIPFNEAEIVRDALTVKT